MDGSLESKARKNGLNGAQPLSPGRLEAFSDGVIAIILTIMVLELKVPATADFSGLLYSWPLFLSYAISYFFVAVYWVNHHHLFHRVKHVDLPILWSNIALLFFLSLVPFFTHWMSATRLSPFPTAIYAATMLVCGSAFFVLHRAVGCQSTAERELVLIERAALRKNLIALGIYAVAIPAAYYRPALALGLIFLVALLYAIPSLWLEHYVEELEAAGGPRR